MIGGWGHYSMSISTFRNSLLTHSHIKGLNIKKNKFHNKKMGIKKKTFLKARHRKCEQEKGEKKKKCMYCYDQFQKERRKLFYPGVHGMCAVSMLLISSVLVQYNLCAIMCRGRGKLKPLNL